MTANPTEMTKPADPSLLGLPRELRDEIFGNLVIYDKVIYTNRGDPRVRNKDSNGDDAAADLEFTCSIIPDGTAMLFANKQLSAEYQDHVRKTFAQNTITIHADDPYETRLSVCEEAVADKLQAIDFTTFEYLYHPGLKLSNRISEPDTESIMKRTAHCRLAFKTKGTEEGHVELFVRDYLKAMKVLCDAPTVGQVQHCEVRVQVVPREGLAGALTLTHLRRYFENMHGLRRARGRERIINVSLASARKTISFLVIGQPRPSNGTKSDEVELFWARGEWSEKEKRVERKVNVNPDWVGAMFPTELGESDDSGA